MAAGMYSSTPMLHVPGRFGMNQHGLKPERHFDFLNPTTLINHGRHTTMATLDTRRKEGPRGCLPSYRGASIIGRDIGERLGLAPNQAGTVHFCHQESASLRICMAQGDGTCEAEYNRLQACLSKVGALRGAMRRAGDRWVDYLHAQVSDNKMKPFEHRSQDQRPTRGQEAMYQATKAGMGPKKSLQGKQPKRLVFGDLTKYRTKGPYARRPRHPANA